MQFGIVIRRRPGLSQTGLHLCHAFFHCGYGALSFFPHPIQTLINFRRGLGCPTGQLPDLIGDDCKSPPCLTSPSRFYGCIER